MPDTGGMGGMGGGYGMILQALGSGIQAAAAAEAQRKMNETFQNALAQQQRYSQQSFGTLEGALPGMGVENARAQMAQGQSQREGLYNQLMGSATSATGPQMSARDTAFGQSSGAVRAKLGSYSDWELMQHLNNIRTQNELNKISNFSQGSASLLPLNLQDAQHSQDELALFGSMLGSLGGSIGNYGSSAPQTYNLNGMINNGYGVSSGYDYNVSPSINSNGDPYNPYSILA